MSWWGKKRFVLTFDYSNQNFFKYKGCFKSNASYFIMLAHTIRGTYWWYDSRGWTFPECSITLTFIGACWKLTEMKEWMLAQWSGEWCVSALTTVTWNTSHILNGHVDFYEHGIQAFVHCWWKCIAHVGDYVDK